MSDQAPDEQPATMSVTVRRARIEEIRGLSEEYGAEQARVATADPPLPRGGVYWIALDGHDQPLGYAAGTLRPEGCTIGPVFTRPDVRRRGVGEALIAAVQHWAAETRVPIVEISVAADNETGRRFLEALGYEPRRILMSPAPVGPRRG